MALHEVVTLQGDLILSDGAQVVIGNADPAVSSSPGWMGQSPGVVWTEWDEPVMCEMALT